MYVKYYERLICPIQLVFAEQATGLLKIGASREIGPSNDTPIKFY